MSGGSVRVEAAEHQQSSDSNAGARIARSNWNKEREPVKGGMKNNLLRATIALIRHGACHGET